MQVKTALAEIRSRPSTFPAVPPEAATAIVALQIPAPSIEVEAKRPPDLDEIAARVISAYSRNGKPERRDMNQAPWCLWEGRRPLAKEPAILARFLADMRFEAEIHVQAPSVGIRREVQRPSIAAVGAFLLGGVGHGSQESLQPLSDRACPTFAKSLFSRLRGSLPGITSLAIVPAESSTNCNIKGGSDEVVVGYLSPARS